MNNKKLTAWDVKKAIARRHADDMFFTEVKDGPTQTVRHHSKIDALAIKISWTNFTIVGYEVKVSRSDFLRDDKWRAYLPMCNQLYFAVAPGVCDPSEVPDVCGLVTMTAKGGLRTVRKAPWREIEEPVSMYKYLMFNYIGAYRMAEQKLSRPERLLKDANLEMYRKYLDDQKSMKEIGWGISKKLSRELQELRMKAKIYDSIIEDDDRASREMEDVCHALGVTSYYRKGEACLAAIEQMKQLGGMTPDVISRIKNLHTLTEALVKSVEEERLSTENEGGSQ